MKDDQASETGYTKDKRWCLRCDVGWWGAAPCWLCGRADDVWRWKPSTFSQFGSTFIRLEEA